MSTLRAGQAGEPRRSGHEVLAGDSRMAALMLGHDWSGSPLGDPATWPQPLRTAVGIALHSRYPMFVAWGPELGFLYNDAYAEILGAKHPAALGRRFHDIWSEIWPDILPLIRRALDGKGTWSDDLMLIMERNGYPEETYFTFSYSPIHDETGGIGGMFCACTETTGRVLAERRLREVAEELRASEQALREERDRLYAMFENTPGFVAALEGKEQRFILTNRAYRRLIGDREVVGLPVREALPDVEGQGFFERLDRVFETGEPEGGQDVPITFRAAPGAEPEERFVDFIYQPVRERDGRISGIFVQGTDVTGRARAARQQRLLLDELNHRVKNNLAIVQSIARTTARGTSSMAEFQQAFQARLSAMARAHDLLSRNAWEAMELGIALREALEPFGPGRFDLHGPALRMGARQTFALGLIVHELASNASKYGALSRPEGRVAIGWGVDRDPGPCLRIEWQEGGGPPVQPPQRRGFGSRLIEGSVASDLRGRLEMEWRPEGLRCTMTAALDAAEAS